MHNVCVCPDLPIYHLWISGIQMANFSFASLIIFLFVIYVIHIVFIGMVVDNHQILGFICWTILCLQKGRAWLLLVC